MVTNTSLLSSAFSTAKPPVNDKSSPLFISDDEVEQQKGFDDSLKIVKMMRLLKEMVQIMVMKML